MSEDATTRTVSPHESVSVVGERLTQQERDGLEAWLRWGQLPDEQLLERAMQKVPVQLAFDR